MFGHSLDGTRYGLRLQDRTIVVPMSPIVYNVSCTRAYGPGLEDKAMRVDDLRRRLLDRVQEVAATGDEGATARITSYARALLVSIVRHPADGEVNVEDLAVGTRTAALILAMHPEYIRFLIRSKHLSATKTDGEFSIPLAEVVRFMDIQTDLDIVGTKVEMAPRGALWPWPPGAAHSHGEKSA